MTASPGGWLGHSGSINDATNYGPSESTVARIGNTNYVLGFANTQIAPPQGSSILFQGKPVYFKGPLEPDPGGETFNPFSQPTLLFPLHSPPDAPIGYFTFTSYTVGGAGTYGDISAGGSNITFNAVLTVDSFEAGFGDITTAGALTVNGALSVGGGVSKYTITSGTTVMAKGQTQSGAVYGFTVGSFADGSGTPQGQAFVNGTLTTQGIEIGSATAGVGAAGALTVAGGGRVTVTDATDASLDKIRLAVGVALGSQGRLTVSAGGQLTSDTADVGADSGGFPGATMTGMATVDGGKWTSNATLTVHDEGMLGVIDGGELDAQHLIVGGMLTLRSAKLMMITPGGLPGFPAAPMPFEVRSKGAVDISLSTLTVALLQTDTGSKFTMSDSVVNDQAGGGYKLNGAVDWTADTVHADSMGTTIKVGWLESADGGDSAKMTSANSTVTTNATFIASDGGALGSLTASLSINGGSWTDETTTGPSITLGGQGPATLTLSNGARLTDDGDALVGAAVSASGLSAGSTVALSGSGTTWRIAGNLFDGSAGDAAITVNTGATLAVDGAITLDGPAHETSSLSILGGTLTYGGAITVGGTARGLFTVTGGARATPSAGAGDITLANGTISVSGESTLLRASTVTVAATGVAPNMLTVSGEATLDAGSELMLSANAVVQLHSGAAIQASTITLDPGAMLQGDGTLTGDVQDNGTIAAQKDLLKLGGGTLSGTGVLVVNAGATLELGTVASYGRIQFDGGNGTLRFDHGFPASMPIAGFAATDTLDLRGFSLTRATLSGSNLLLYDYDVFRGSIELSGSYVNPVFSTTSTPGVGSTVTLTSGGLDPNAPVMAPHHDDLSSTMTGPQALALAPITDAGATSTTPFSASLTVGSGTLALGDGGAGATITQDAPGRVAITGTLAQVNAALATLTYAATVPGVDTVTITASDDSGNADTQSFTVTQADTAPSETLPGAQSVVAGTAAPIQGIVIVDSSGLAKTYTVTLDDGRGVLSATPTGAASVGGGGTAALSVTGSLADVNATLATLTYLGAGVGSDSVSVAVDDGAGGTFGGAVGITVAAASSGFVWAQPVDGAFADGNSWQSGVPPGAGDGATLGPGTYAVSGPGASGLLGVTGNVTETGALAATPVADYRALLVDAVGALTIAGTGAFTGAGAAVGGDGSTGELNLQPGGTLTLTGANAYLYLGLSTGGEGTLTADGASLTIAQGASIGYRGGGEWTLGGAATATLGGDVFVAAFTGTTGTLTVTDAGSRLSAAGDLVVGDEGTAVLSVEAGGAITSGDAAIGLLSGGEGIATVSDAGSTWHIANGLTVGDDGAGNLFVFNGAAVTIDTGNSAIGNAAGSSGELFVDGAGSAFTTGGFLGVGYAGAGSLLVQDSASVSAARIGIGVSGAGSGDVQVGAGSSLNVTGTIVVGGGASGTLQQFGDATIGAAEIEVEAGGVFSISQATSLTAALLLAGGEIDGEVDITQSLSVATGSSTLGGTMDVLGGVAFVAGGAQLLAQDGVVLGSTITGFAGGDGIDLAGLVTTGFGYDPGSGVLTLDTASGPSDLTFAGSYAPSDFSVVADAAGTGTEISVACFAHGTRIRTPGGDVAVELLAIGDPVVTTDGVAPVRWLGRRCYAGRFLAGKPRLWPIRIRAGALGPGTPSRDLTVSPRHAMFLDGVLVPADALVNGASIARVRGPDRIDYVHVELDEHAILFAEDAPTESFRDEDSRAMFHNAAEYDHLYPGAPPPGACVAPRLEDGPEIAAIRRRLDTGVAQVR